jgi:hypothetical protein
MFEKLRKVSSGPINMRQKFISIAFLGVALIATGGWVWLLFVGLKRLI